MNEFLRSEGEMARLIRNFDWTSTPVGPPKGWPASLRSAVRLMLNTQHPMFIWWGEDLVQFYNDAYRATMGSEMHPAALGARGRECWADIWPIIGPQIDMVMAGLGSTWNVDQLVPIVRHGKREDVWWTYGYSPIDLDDRVGGVLVVCTDVTERHLYAEALKDRTGRLAQQFEQAPGFIAVLVGEDHRFELANAAYRRMVGGRDLVGHKVRDVFPEIVGQGFFELLDQVYRSGVAYVGRRAPIQFSSDTAKPLSTRYIDFVYQAIREVDGSISGVFVEGQDVTEHVHAEQRLVLLNEELQHRVKNMLAVIGAVADQTLKHSVDKVSLKAFQSRLVAFSNANAWLTKGPEGIGLAGEVVEISLGPHRSDGQTYTVSGPDVELGTRQTVGLAMIINELATNAVKYGALSTPNGRVHVRWGLEESDSDIFFLEWQEIGGPPARQPERVGFGSRLIDGVVSSDFVGECTRSFTMDGLRFRMTGRSKMQEEGN